MDIISAASFLIGVGLTVWILYRDREYLRKRLDNALEKIDTMSFEIAELKEKLGYEQGGFDKAYMDAKQQKRIDDLKRAADVQPEQKGKSGRRGDK